MTFDQWHTPASPTIRFTVWLLVGFFAVTGVGSYIAKTEIVARGEGKIIPTSRVQAVQPRSDGKITAILVSEGQSVRRGQPLVVMDDSAVRGEINRFKAEMARQSQDIAIAKSILTPLDRGDPADKYFINVGREALRSGGHEPPADTVVLTVAVLSALSDQIAQIDAQVFRTQQMKQVQGARIEKASSEWEILRQRFAASERLKGQGTISNFEYLERLRLLNAAKNEVAIAERELSGLVAEAEVVSKQRRSAISDVRSTYRKQLSAATIASQGLQGELAAAEQRLIDLSITAPSNGTVENLSVFTVGGFVEAGANLMSVVPSGGGIEVEAFFDNRDIGFLAEGQKAFVKLDAFPAERFGMVRGTVASVGADARPQPETKRWVYAVRLRLDQDAIRIGARMAAFAPGMTATVDVITGERRLISYFFEPIVKALQDSFGER